MQLEIPKDHRFLDLTGRIIGRLHVLRYDGPKRQPCGALTHRWLCRCSCGSVKSFYHGNLIGGKTRSCRCLRIEGNTKHGHTKHPLYKTWRGMIARCDVSAANGYDNYGGRGIRVCPQWCNFEVFARDVGPKPSPGDTLDRIDSDGHYEPGNVRWANCEVQNWNRHGVHMVNLCGDVIPFSVAAVRIGVTPAAMRVWGIRHNATAQETTDFYISKYGYRR